MKIDHCMFDFDGTLFDTLADIIDNLRLAFARNGIPPQSLHIETIMQLQLRDSVASCVPGISPERIDAIVDAFKAGYDASDYPGTRLLPGAVEVIELLRSRGIGMSIVSNKRQTPTLRILEKFGLSGFFSGIYNPDMFSGGKPPPKPRLMAYALEQLGLSPKTTAYIGDSEIDVLAAKENGLLSIFVENGYGKAKNFRMPPDVTVKDLSGILPLIGA